MPPDPARWQNALHAILRVPFENYIAHDPAATTQLILGTSLVYRAKSPSTVYSSAKTVSPSTQPEPNHPVYSSARVKSPVYSSERANSPCIQFSQSHVTQYTVQSEQSHPYIVKSPNIQFRQSQVTQYTVQPE